MSIFVLRVPTHNTNTNARLSREDHAAVWTELGVGEEENNTCSGSVTFRPIWEIMTDRPTDQPTNGQTRPLCIGKLRFQKRNVF